MIGDSDWLLPAAGLLCGFVLGGVARWNHFCTLSALERYWYGNDSKGLRTWVLAAAVALLGTQTLIATELIELQNAHLLSPHVSIVGSAIGGILFGIGMALVGTCSFGALVRLGGGSLRSLVVVVGIALAALSAQRGLNGQLRLGYIEPLAINLTNTDTQSLGDILSAWFSASVHYPVALACGALLLLWVFKDPNYRTAYRSQFTGFVVGTCIVFGWFITATLSDKLFSVVQLESASFVMPPGDVVLSFIAFTGTIPDYGIGLVVGVVIGSSVSACIHDDVHWEACDDARELSRHLLGAFLMGTGGVLAAGCTIGQGISAMSVMALTAPIVFICICIGARIGLRWLLEGPPSLFTRSS